MSDRGAQVVILCEDKQGEVFFRRLLVHLGYSRRRLYVRPYPAKGHGAGDSHVIREFPKEVVEQRRKAPRLRQGLVVTIDADTRTTDERFVDLWRQVLSPRGDGERIAVFIPKRNIETWIHYLLGEPGINEDDNYSKFKDRERECQPAVERFAEMAKVPPPDGCLPSLVRGLEETRRLP